MWIAAWPDHMPLKVPGVDVWEVFKTIAACSLMRIPMSLSNEDPNESHCNPHTISAEVPQAALENVHPCLTSRVASMLQNTWLTQKVH